jgi:hypothetical protein
VAAGFAELISSEDAFSVRMTETARARLNATSSATPAAGPILGTHHCARHGA